MSLGINLRVDLMVFANGLNSVCKSQKRVKNDSPILDLSHWMSEDSIYCVTL